MARGAPLNELSGRRGNYRWTYGLHGWFLDVQSDFSAGIVRDRPRSEIPANGVYDAVDYLVHQPGALIGRGPTAYAGPAMTAATYAAAVAYAEFPAGSSLVAVGNNGHIYTVTSGTTTDLGGSTVTTVDTPKLRIGGSKNLLIFPQSNGTGGPIKYDGSAAPGSLGGTPAAGKYCALYKSRLALGNSSANPNRVYFSPTPDIESTWDTTNAWVDFDHSITGLAALQNALVVFSLGHTERLTGSTPPPGSDMDRAPIGDVGCSDARSIAIYQNSAVFASPSGVYVTNGTGFQSLTEKKDGLGISSYWRSLFSGYDPSTWVISGGVHKDFYFVSIVDSTGTLVVNLLYHFTTGSWTRLSNFTPVMFAAAVGAVDDLYYADRSTNRVGHLSNVVSNDATSVSGSDANGNTILPSVITRGFGGSPSLKAFGDVFITADYIDTSPISGQTLAVSYATGVTPTTYTATGNSPISARSSVSPGARAERYQFSTGGDGAFLALQIAASGGTRTPLLNVIRSIEVSMRPYPISFGGP